MKPDLEKFFDLSLDMMCIASEDFRFRWVSSGFETTLGWTCSELLRRPYLDFVHPDDLDATIQESASLSEGQPTVRFQNRYRCADGSYKVLLWSSQRDPETGLFYAIARDVTWAREIEQQLLEAKNEAEAADRTKSLFLASMSHEIRTPMSGVLGMADLALERTEDPDLRHYLQTIRESSEALLDLINDILDFSKIEAGHLQLELHPFGLRELAGNVVKTLAVTAHRKKLPLNLRVAPEVPDGCYGDAGRLRQVLVNLVGNAIKFTDEGEVRLEVVPVTADPDTARLRFEVRDTGIGILEEFQGRVFERFWQAQGQTALARGGTGLGLAISSQLVSLMNGEIGVESPPGGGSCFWFEIPVRLVEGNSKEHPLSGDLGAARVMLFEAHPTSREIIAEMLSRRFREVVVAADRDEAIRLARDASEAGRTFDLYLVDCDDAVGRDFDLVAELLSHRGQKSRFVVCIDSAFRPGEARRCRKLHLDGYLVKPVVATELDQVLARVFDLDSDEQPIPLVEGAASRSLRVLLAEDSLVNQQVATGLLESRGHRVDVVTDGEAAVSAATDGNYDALLMDLRMPGLDGISATRRIRETEKETGRHLSIVGMTAQAGRSDEEQCRQAGMDAYVSKPLRARELLSTIEQVTRNRRAERQPASIRLPDSELVDWTAALAATGGQRRLLDRLVQAAIEEVPTLLGEMHDAHRRKDRETLIRNAHTLKGTLRYFGSSQLLLLVEELENQPADAAQVERNLEALAAPLDHFVEALSHFTPADPAQNGKGTPEEIKNGHRAGRR